MTTLIRAARRAAIAFAWVGGAWLAPAVPARAQPVVAVVEGAGASFPAKVYARWAEQFAQEHRIEVRYRATGSGDGIQQAATRSVDFGGTDSPLQPADLEQKRLIQIPMLVGGIVPVVNFPGLDGRNPRLTGELLAEIMAGSVERWDDPRISALNPGLPLPARKIVRVVRADKSGTTEGFTRYLSKVSERFKVAVGVHSLPRWPGIVQSEEGNDGIVAALKRHSGAIGYVSHDRVEPSGLTPVMLKNQSGHWVLPSEPGFRAAILQSGLHRQGNDTASILDMPGTESWPITLTSFVLVDASPSDVSRVEPALQFLYWCFQRGDALTRGTGFAPLPTAVQARLAARFHAVQPRSGVRPKYQVY